MFYVIQVDPLTGDAVDTDNMIDGDSVSTVSELENSHISMSLDENSASCPSATKRPLLKFKKAKKLEQELAEHQLLKSSIECMTKASENLTSTSQSHQRDDISTFANYVEEELRRMRVEGHEMGVRTAKLRIQQILFEAQNTEQLREQLRDKPQHHQQQMHLQPHMQLQQQPCVVWSPPHSIPRALERDEQLPHSQSPHEGRWYYQLP